ncbi:MAG TPA: hypothetical protein PK572_08665, partial [Kiritimatiellia bacterium]|nr:hypothetical protein [Kiritimatiellia bacterium]
MTPLPPTFSTVWKNPRKVCRCARYGSLARPAASVAIELAFAHHPAGSGSALAYFPLCGKVDSKFFHCVEKWTQSFSIAWKNRTCFSTVWKTFFHGVEKFGLRGVVFSTVWKLFFHSVEKYAADLGGAVA